MRYERGHEENALIEPSLLRNRDYLSGIAVVLFFFGAFSGLLLCVSLYGQLGEGWSPLHAGLTLTPMVIGIVIGMTISFALVERLGRHLLHIGIVLIAVGNVVIALVLDRRRTTPGPGTSCPGCCSSARARARASPSCSASSWAASTWTRSAPPPACSRPPSSSRPRSASRCSGRSSSRPSGTTSPTDALQITAWACLAPLVGAFLLDLPPADAGALASRSWPPPRREARRRAVAWRAPVRVHLVDPSAFTPPYDRALALRWRRRGRTSRSSRRGSPTATSRRAEGYAVDERFYRRAVGAPGSRVRLAAKLAEHVPEMVAYARAAPRRADVVHFQWLTVQPLDVHLLPRGVPDRPDRPRRPAARAARRAAAGAAAPLRARRPRGRPLRARRARG